MNLKGTSPIFFKGLLIIKSHSKNLELKMTCVKLSIPLCTDWSQHIGGFIMVQCHNWMAQNNNCYHIPPSYTNTKSFHSLTHGFKPPSPLLMPIMNHA